MGSEKGSKATTTPAATDEAQAAAERRALSGKYVVLYETDYEPGGIFAVVGEGEPTLFDGDKVDPRKQAAQTDEELARLVAGDNPPQIVAVPAASWKPKAPRKRPATVVF